MRPLAQGGSGGGGTVTSVSRLVVARRQRWFIGHLATQALESGTRSLLPPLFAYAARPVARNCGCCPLVCATNPLRYCHTAPTIKVKAMASTLTYQVSQRKMLAGIVRSRDAEAADVCGRAKVLQKAIDSSNAFLAQALATEQAACSHGRDD